MAVTPALSSEITNNYTARVNAATINLEATATRPGARIVSIALGGVSALLNPDDNLLSAAFNLTEGATTHFSLTVRAADGVTTENYVIAFSRPGDPAVPDITIEASRARICGRPWQPGIHPDPRRAMRRRAWMSPWAWPSPGSG